MLPTLPLQRYVQPMLHPFTTYQWRVRAATIQDSVILWSNYTEVIDVTTSAAGEFYNVQYFKILMMVVVVIAAIFYHVMNPSILPIEYRIYICIPPPWPSG